MLWLLGAVFLLLWRLLSRVTVAVGVLVAVAVVVAVAAGEPVAVVNGVQARRRQTR